MGDSVGKNVTTIVGSKLGTSVGRALGKTEGIWVDTEIVGNDDGPPLGENDGERDGT